ncbi:mannose 6-phosphate receptor domain-containing protein [Rickenella mellea]|uniref:Mannose 6-phosphate receptor domain-containing protein n=1 Tax=Rickenella mellea TaxID=50990 RepID=A0A4Y7QG75_9AGAM|nr:mannose 6-phosphate receptor domain-containing protein [Rickenella mellea]
MRSARYALAIALGLSVSAALAEDKPCTGRGEGKFFDLNPLRSKKDYTFKSPSGREFVLNVCQSVSHETWNLKVDKPEDVAGFTRGERGDLSIGDVNTTVLVRDGSPVLLLADGSPCPKSSSMKASSAIRFICDTAVSGNGQPQFIAQLPPDEEDACSFFIEWRSQYACPTSAWSSFAVVSIVFLSVFLFLALVAVCSYYARRRGMDFSISGLYEAISYYIHDCFTWITHRDPWGSGGISRGLGGWPGRRRDGFERLPRTREEEESIIHSQDGRFSLDEEDEAYEHRTANGDGRSLPQGMDGSGVIRL